MAYILCVESLEWDIIILYHHSFAHMSYHAVTWTQVRNINEQDNKAQNKLALTVALDRQN